MPPIRTDKLNEIVRRTNESNSARLRALIEQRRRDLSLDGSPLMYQPYQPSVPDTPTPLRYEPQPHYGLYEYPASAGIAEVYPITTSGMAAVPVAASEPEEIVEDLFSEDAIARRALKQRYAESNFDNRAKSHAGAMGAWQIMPITYKDYLGRGRGKAGDLNDPEYNRKVRDWVMGIIPRDLQDLYSENDAPRVKLAKIYGAYNWGAGNMRKYLRKQREAGVDISNDTAWVEGLNPETKRYIKYLALDEDIPDSTYTNKAFEEAAAKRGYMKDGGPIHIKPSHRGRLTELKERTGKTEAELYNDGNPAHKRMVVFARNARKWKHGDGGYMNKYDGETEETQQMQRQPWWQRMIMGSMLNDPMTGAVATASGWTRDKDGNVVQTEESANSEGARQLRNNLAVIGATGLGSLLGGSGLLYDIGKSAAVGIDTMGRMAMPSTFLKGAATYVPKAAGALEAASPWLDAGALSLWSAKAGQSAIDAGKRGDVGTATATGTMVFMPFMPLAARGYQAARNLGNSFRLSPYQVADMAALEPALAQPEVTLPSTAKVAAKAAQSVAPYAIEDLGGGYMLKSLMRGNPLEKQISKNGTVNVNNVRALVGKGSKVEQAVVDKVLASEEFAGKKSIDYNKFRKAVQDELITYERVPNEGYAEYGMDRIGQKPQLSQWSSDWATANNFIVAHPELDYAVDDAGNIFAAREVPGLGKIYDEPVPWEEISQRYPGWKQKYAMRSATPETFTFESPRIPNGSAKHYGPNTLGHSRTYTAADEPDVLHVMESQSDWAQQANRGSKIKKDPMSGWIQEKNRIRRIEDTINQAKNNLANGLKPDGTPIEHEYERHSIEEFIKNEEGHLPDARARLHKYELVLQPEKYVQEKYLQQEYTSRQIQENLRYAAEKGQTKMRYPTRETAAKIEGYQPIKDTGKKTEVFDWLKKNNRESSPYSSDIYEKTKNYKQQ